MKRTQFRKLVVPPSVLRCAVNRFISAVALHSERTIIMTVKPTEATSVKRRPYNSYWAWPTPVSASTGVIPGRLLIPKATYDLWATEKPATVEVLAANGFLGATVILDIRAP